MIDESMVAAIAAEVVEVLDPRIERMERAILGEGSIGHIGLVDRVKDLEVIARNIDTVHGQIDDRRVDGDRRLHERIDHIHNGKASTEDMLRLSGEVSKMARKFDRVIWIVAGVGIGSGGLTAWLTSLASG